MAIKYEVALGLRMPKDGMPCNLMTLCCMVLHKALIFCVLLFLKSLVYHPVPIYVKAWIYLFMAACQSSEPHLFLYSSQ